VPSRDCPPLPDLYPYTSLFPSAVTFPVQSASAASSCPPSFDLTPSSRLVSADTNASGSGNLITLCLIGQPHRPGNLIASASARGGHPGSFRRRLEGGGHPGCRLGGHRRTGHPGCRLEGGRPGSFRRRLAKLRSPADLLEHPCPFGVGCQCRKESNKKCTAPPRSNKPTS